MRLGLLVLGALAAGCAGDDPVGLFAESRIEPEPVVEREALDVDLEALEAAAAEPEPEGPPSIEIPANAIDVTDSPIANIEIVDNAFTERVIVITAGTEVVWTNAGRNEHNIRPAIKDAFASISATALAEKGDSASLVFDEPGDYPYFCSLHGTATNGQTGRIIVVSTDSA